jgi:hypothetical protein
LLDEARLRVNEFEIQDEDEGTQVVRVWGDTAVVTARLRIKGTNQKGAFDRTLWFSDTYVRTPTGWRYAFAQASLPIPPEKTRQAELAAENHPLPSASRKVALLCTVDAPASRRQPSIALQFSILEEP